jgi:hypothetical protein
MLGWQIVLLSLAGLISIAFGIRTPVMPALVVLILALAGAGLSFFF